MDLAQEGVNHSQKHSHETGTNVVADGLTLLSCQWSTGCLCQITPSSRPLPLGRAMPFLHFITFCSATFFAFQVLGVIVIPASSSTSYSSAAFQLNSDWPANWIVFCLNFNDFKVWTFLKFLHCFLEDCHIILICLLHMGHQRECYIDSVFIPNNEQELIFIHLIPNLVDTFLLQFLDYALDCTDLAILDVHFQLSKFICDSWLTILLHLLKSIKRYQ